MTTHTPDTPDVGLLPCPHCGGPAEYDSARWSGIGSGSLNVGHTVYCSDCPLPRVGGCVQYETKNEAVEHWNTRATDQTVDDCAALIRQLVHALRKASPTSDLASRAMDYLKRKGLQGSPLREGKKQAAEIAQLRAALMLFDSEFLHLIDALVSPYVAPESKAATLDEIKTRAEAARLALAPPEEA